MMELFAGGSFIAIGVFVILAILMPICVYSAQKWAYRCYKELAKANQILERLETSANSKNG
jgi:hypothetical protein